MRLSSFTLTAIVIIFIGSVIRLYRIDQPLLEFFPPRQTQTAEITRNIYINGWVDFWTPKVRYFTGSPTPYVLEFPIYNGLVVMLYFIFGPNIIFGRITSLVLFIITSIIFYKLAKQSIGLNKDSVVYSLLFFVFSPLHILVSRTFQPEELALFLLLSGIYLRSWTLFSLATLVKLPIVLFAPAMLLATRKKNQFLDLSSIFKLSLSLLPVFIWFYRAKSLVGQEEHIARNFTLSNWFQPDLWLTLNWYWALFQIETVWVLTFIGSIMLACGFSSIYKNQFKLWKIWLICGIVYLVLFNYHAMTHEYYHILLLPPLAMIMGQGLSIVLSKVPVTSQKKTFVIISTIIFITINLIKPAIKKISDSPQDVTESKEIPVSRYNMTTTFK